MELCAVLAADSYFDPDTIDWLDGQKRIASSGIRNGFVPGEAAGCLVVAAHDTAKRLGLPRLAKVHDVRSAVEATADRMETESLGRALSEVFAAVTASLRLPDEAVDRLFCDINGERHRTEEWGFTALRAGAALRTTDYITPVACCGDVGAASGALLCALAVQAWARGYAAGPRAAILCSSDGGLRSAALLELTER